jgi:hypothetical protein
MLVLVSVRLGVVLRTLNRTHRPDSDGDLLSL